MSIVDRLLVNAVVRSDMVRVVGGAKPKMDLRGGSSKVLSLLDIMDHDALDRCQRKKKKKCIHAGDPN